MTRLLILLLLITLASPAYATRYWVDPTGNDSNACASVDGDTDPGVYKLTPAGGKACLASGDTLTIKAGTYTGSNAYIDGLPAGLSASQPTIVEGDPADSAGCAISESCGVILQPTVSPTRITVGNVVMRKLRLDNTNLKTRYPLEVSCDCSTVLVEDVEFTGTQTSGASSASGTLSTPGAAFVTYRRIYSHHTGDPTTVTHHGMYLQGDDTVVEDSLIEDSGNAGIQCQTTHTTSDGRPDRCIVRNSIIRNNPSSAIIIEGFDSLVYGNLLHDNGGVGVLLGFGGADRTKVFNNLIYNNSTGGVRFGQSGASHDAVAYNNIITGNGGAEVQINGGTGSLYTHNACLSSETCTTANKLTIASLSSIVTSTSDFRLISGSAAIDAGTPIAGFSYNGAAPDIGAYESVNTFTGSITTNLITLTASMNVDVPINIPSAAGVTISCTGANCPGGGLTASSATRKSGTDSQVEIVVAGFAGDACVSTNQTITVSYTTTSGTWTSATDKAGNGLRQQIFSFSNLAITNNCTGSGPTTFPPGTPLIYYNLNDGSGTTAANSGSSGDTDNATLTGTWVSGKTGTGLLFASGTTESLSMPYGSGVNPTTQSLTFAVAVFVPSGSETTRFFVAGPSIGANQRGYIGAYQGTWRASIQSTALESTGSSNLTVTAGWNFLTLVFNSTTDVATLYKDGVAGTGGATRAYTSYTFASDFLVGRISGNNAFGGIYDDIVLYTSVEDPATLYAAWNPPPVTVGTFGMPSYRFQAVYLPELGGSPTNFGTAINQAKKVVAGGAVAVLLEVYCQNVSNCDASSFRLESRQNSVGGWTQVPDAENDTHIYMWGPDTNTLLNAGATTSRISAGSCTVTNGVTILTSAQVPVYDLPQDGCVVLRYIVRIGETASGYHDLRVSKQGGEVFTGTVNEARITVVGPQGSAQ